MSVRILRLASGGDGVGKLEDGRTVFVPRTAPGDLVELTALQVKRSFARGRVAVVLEPGPDRREPPCPHYTADECGGCQLQHLAYPAQVRAKEAMVGETLRRVGKLEVEDPVVEPSPSEWEYRTRLSLAVDHRTGAIGLRRYDRPDDIFELRSCPITDPLVVGIWSALQPHRELLPAGTTRLRLRLDRTGARHLVVEADAGPGEAGEELAANMDDVGVTVWWRAGRGAAVPLSPAPGVPALAFQQVHPAMGDRVRQAAVAAAGPLAGARVWDLYAGIGETTALLAGAGALVESVELDRDAVGHATRTLASLGPFDAAPRLVRGRVEEETARLSAPVAIITNPPRTGMEPRATEAVARSGARRVVYVSCDPATLARDLARLADRFRLVDLRSFDLFPNTAHVESVATLEAV